MIENNQKAKSLFIVLFVYVVSCAIGYVFTVRNEDLHPIINIGIADVICTLIVFGFSFWYKNSSMYSSSMIVFMDPRSSA